MPLIYKGRDYEEVYIVRVVVASFPKGELLLRSFELQFAGYKGVKTTSMISKGLRTIRLVL